MMANHDLVVEAGGNAAVVNINSIGYGGMTFLRKRSQSYLHAHRNGWDILTRHPGLGMEFHAYQKILRLLGVASVRRADSARLCATAGGHAAFRDD
jgi:3-oxoisoapionate-4-phosphate decarboxylase